MRQLQKSTSNEPQTAEYTYSYGYFLLHKLQELIRKLPYTERIKLKNLAYCNCRALGGSVPIVKETKYDVDTGEIYSHKAYSITRACSNTWCCPRCSIRLLNKARRKVDRMIIGARQQGIGAIMATWTIPHQVRHSAAEIVERFRTAMKILHSPSLRHRKRYAQIIGNIQTREVTYGPNGWHLHCHMLLFIPCDYNAEQLEKYIKQCNHDLEEYYKTLDGYNENHDPERNFYVSRNDDGTIRFTTNAEYVTAHALSKELTFGSNKQVHQKGHYQLLDLLDSDNEKLNEKYLEWCLTMANNSKHPLQRIYYSKTIAKFLCSEESYQEVLEARRKKKNLPKCGTTKETICLFGADSWFEICEAERMHHVPYIYEMLKILEKDGNGKDVMEYCRINVLPIPVVPKIHYRGQTRAG